MPLFGPPNVRDLAAKKDVAGLQKALGYQRDYRVRAAAAAALSQADPPDLGPLISLLGDRDRDARRAAAVALGKIHLLPASPPADETSVARGEPESRGQIESMVESLIALLSDRDRDVRSAAAAALGRIGDRRAVDQLIAALADQDDEVTNAATTALGRIGDVRAVDPLVGILGDSADGVGRRSVRAQAADSLGRIGDPRAVEPLIAALGDNDLRVREHAAEALGRIGDGRALEPLTAALREGDWNMREVAAAALEQLNDRTAS